MADVPAQTGAAPQPPPPNPPPLTDSEKETMDELYAQLKEQAKSYIHDWVAARIPVRFQFFIKDQLDADFPLPEPPAPAAPSDGGTQPSA